MHGHPHAHAGMPNDSGPIYLETMMGRFPVEPWSTASNLLFLAMIVYWAWRVCEDLAAHRFIVFALPVLFVGWVGGTVYHATRSADIWLYLDFGPIALSAMAVGVFFWRRQGVGWPGTVALVLGPIVLAIAINVIFNLSHAMQAVFGYPALAIAILLPVLRYLRNTGWANWHYVAGGLGVFAAAVFFRTIDLQINPDVMPMGTHFLWHSLGAVAVHLLVVYIWRSDVREAAVPFGSTARAAA